MDFIISPNSLSHICRRTTVHFCAAEPALGVYGQKGADLNMCLDQYAGDELASTAWSTNIIRRRPV